MGKGVIACGMFRLDPSEQTLNNMLVYRSSFARKGKGGKKRKRKKEEKKERMNE